MRPSARADEPERNEEHARAQADETETRREYRRLIERAVSEHERENWAEARALLLQAHAEKPSGRTLMSLGMVEYELRAYARARRYLRGALKASEGSLSSEQREHVLELLQQIASYLSEYKLRLMPADLTLQIDGVEPSLEPDGKLLLSAGRHRLTAHRTGYQSAERVLDVPGGAGLTLLDVQLIPTQPSPEVMPTNSPDSLTVQRRTGLSLLYTAAATLVSAAVTGGWALREVNRARAQQGGPSERAERLARASDVQLAASAVLLGVGLPFYIVHARWRKKQQNVHEAPQKAVPASRLTVARVTP